jgi:hypothetical protein
MEAALALAILASSTALTSGMFYSDSLNNNAMRANNAMYDIFMALLENRTYGSCASNSCIDVGTLLGRFRGFYNLSYASLSYGDRLFSNGTSSCRYESRFCLPLNLGSGFQVSCLTLCD